MGRLIKTQIEVSATTELAAQSIKRPLPGMAAAKLSSPEDYAG
jgi:hypothetical protein